MKRKDAERMADEGFELIEPTRRGARVRGPEGKEYWLSTRRPVNPAMVTDFYEMSMAAAYIESGMEDTQATFNVFYRRNPFDGGYTIFTGLNEVIEYLENFEFDGKDIDHMKENWDMPDSFFEYMREVEFNGDVDALPEGSMAQPYVPLMQVTAPLPVANMVETYILNQLGFPTLVSTKSARIRSQVDDKKALEFGLRRAQGGTEGGLLATRAAYIGGFDGTSNVAAEQVCGIPAGGTQAHSFVMAFPSQLEAFKAYADVFKEESVFLIDTYGFEQGTREAIEAAKDLGLDTFLGVRDDSGDLAYHSRVIREILDDNGFEDVKIAASNEIDEHVARSLEEQGAKIDLYGVGTNLVTAKGSPSLGIVYKLVEIDGRPVIKISANDAKITDPGKKRVIRCYENGHYAGDVMTAKGEVFDGEVKARHRSRSFDFKTFNTDNAKPLLVPAFRNGEKVYRQPDLEEVKKHASEEMQAVWPEMMRLKKPAEYFVGLSPRLAETKDILMEKHAIER